MKPIDITGERYGRLTVLNKEMNIRGKTAWKCLCDCGNEVIVITEYLRSGRTQSCGCLAYDALIARNIKPIEFKIEGNTAVCRTTSGVEFYVDAEDVDKITDRSWSQCGRGYLHGWNPKIKKCVYLHKLLLGVDGEDVVVDHKDRNVLNNRKSNLRICTAAENARNASKKKNNTSGFPGVHKEKKTGRWVARIGFDGKEINLGTYGSFREAVYARYKGEKKYFGEFAPHSMKDIIDEAVEELRTELYKTFGEGGDVDVG